jgi:replicative DNA helicase
MELLMSSTDTSVSSADLIMKTGQFAESLREEMDTEKDTQHISEVLNELGAEVEERQRLKAEGKALRVPTGIYSLDYLTYGGFNAGNLIILAARPSVGKTAVMLQMAMAAAKAGKSVNLYNLEMTNTELAQRMLFATGRLTPLQMARGEVEWKEFELASGEYASRPLYLNDSVSTAEEIISRISLNAQRGKCDIAFIDYLGLIQMSSRLQLKEAIAEVTKRLKNVAKEYRIPIVLLCQLNRASASENRPPMMHDLRDSGAIEQDADIILMLERSAENEGEINMWVRKNRQGKAGDVKVELKANETFTAFADKNEPVYEPPPMPDYDFESNNQEFPF